MTGNKKDNEAGVAENQERSQVAQMALETFKKVSKNDLSKNVPQKMTFRKESNVLQVAMQNRTYVL
jgi:hypothetical protein